jgi:hygromycin-B 7''-O-kinase
MDQPSSHLLSPLYTLDGYRRYFTDARFWEPFVLLVSAREQIPVDRPPRSGLPGTFPTFIVSEKWVVKFFGPLFDGPTCYQVEVTASQLLAHHNFPIPALLAIGNLYPPEAAEFPWPYLIYDYIPALSIGEVYDEVSFDSMQALAHRLGGLLHRMHSISLQPGSVLPANWDFYLNHLTRLSADCQSRHAAWASLPPHLLSEIPSYLLPLSDLLPPSASPSLIHADLTRDHLLGDLQGGDWHLRAMIDFGDALSGDLFYELVVLHLELFNADRRLLREFLLAYQPSPFHQQNFIHKAMTLTLLHPYDAFALPFARHPALRECTSLEELAHSLWNVYTIAFNSKIK